MISRTLRGVVHGKTIEFDQDLGVPDGEQIEVIITATDAGKDRLAALQRCAGGMAPYWTEQDDQILEEIYRSRKAEKHREIDE